MRQWSQAAAKEIPTRLKGKKSQSGQAQHGEAMKFGFF